MSEPVPLGCLSLFGDGDLNVPGMEGQGSRYLIRDKESSWALSIALSSLLLWETVQSIGYASVIGTLKDAVLLLPAYQAGNSRPSPPHLKQEAYRLCPRLPWLL